MNDPIEMAKQRAGKAPGEPQAEPEVIRKPGKAKPERDQDTNLITKGGDENSTYLTQADLDVLLPQERDQLLRDLLKRNNSHIDRERDLQILDRELDLENKRKFSNLGFKLASGFGVFTLVAITAIISLLVYAVRNDKSMIDGTIIGVFLNTFAEVFKTIFSVM